MNCQEANELSHAYADDEIEVALARELDQHLRDCPSCRQDLERIRAIKTAVSNSSLYYKAPAELRARVALQIDDRAGEGEAPAEPILPTRLRLGRSLGLPDRVRPWSRGVSWGLAIAAMILIALGIFWRVHTDRENVVVAEVLTAHARSLQPSHLMDVISTDQHTVKPWFDTHVDFSPPVRQLAPDFPLQGGRLDYLEEHPVAALVYGRRKHIINLFIWPGYTGQGTSERRGFNVIHWSTGGMTFWAVSDLNSEELKEFAQRFREPGAPATTQATE